MEFNEELYPEKYDTNLKIENLLNKKNNLIKILNKTKFKNNNNIELIKNIDKYFDILKKIGISNKTTPMITLPKSETFDLILKYKNGYADLIINLKDNKIIYIEDMEIGDSIKKEYTINETNFNKIKNLLKTRF